MTRELIPILLCCVAFGLAGCGKPPEQVLQEAKALHAGGDRNAAILQVKSLLQEEPENAAARLYLGLLNLEAGDFAGAEKELRRAQDRGADPVQVLPALARALLMQGESKKLLDEIDPAKVSDPTAASRILAARGMAHFALRQVDDAKASFDKALSIKPEAPEALSGRARLLAVDQKLPEALGEVERALKSDSKDPDARMLQGDLLRAAGKIAEAEQAYRQLVEAHPQHLNGQLALVSIAVADNRLDEASKYLAAARKAAPGSPMAAYFQGLIAFRKGDFKAARDSIEAVLKVAPNHLPSVLLGGAIEFALGSHELAQARLKFVVERAPGSIYARRVLAASYARVGQTQKALETLEPALSAGTKDPAILALAGEVHMQLNEYDKARGFFQKAAALDPKDARMRTGLGLSRLAAGEVDAATADLESASQLDTSRNQADVLLVATHLQRKQFDQALKAAQSLVSKRPESPVGHNLVAAAYLGKNDEASARTALMKALEVQPGYVPSATNLAQLDLGKGDKKAARKRLEDIIARDKNNVQAYIALAHLGGQVGASNEEIQGWLEAARSVDPGAIQPVVLLTRLLMQTGKGKQALELLDKAIVASPERRELLELAGQVQLSAGEKNRALSTFGKLVTSFPSASSFYLLSTAQVANGDNASARKSLRSALEQREAFPEAQLLLAEIESQAGRADEALRVASKLQAQNPRSPAGWVSEGDILFRAKKFTPSAKAYEKAFALGPSGTIMVRWYNALASDGREKEGVDRMRDWIKRNPADHVARLFLAERFLRMNRFAEAAGEYEVLASKAGDNVVVLNNLAWAYSRIKDARALPIAERALKLQSDNPAVLDTVGWILVEGGDVSRGVDLLKRATELAPKSAEIRHHYAQGLLKAGNAFRGKQELERVLAEFPDYSQRPEVEKLLATLAQVKR